MPGAAEGKELITPSRSPLFGNTLDLVQLMLTRKKSYAESAVEVCLQGKATQITYSTMWKKKTHHKLRYN